MTITRFPLCRLQLFPSWSHISYSSLFFRSLSLSNPFTLFWMRWFLCVVNVWEYELSLRKGTPHFMGVFTFVQHDKWVSINQCRWLFSKLFITENGIHPNDHISFVQMLEVIHLKWTNLNGYFRLKHISYQIINKTIYCHCFAKKKKQNSCFLGIIVVVKKR